MKIHDGIIKQYFGILQSSRPTIQYVVPTTLCASSNIRITLLRSIPWTSCSCNGELVYLIESTHTDTDTHIDTHTHLHTYRQTLGLST